MPHDVLQYHHDPRRESFGDEAVDELAATAGVTPEQIFKTLVIALPKGWRWRCCPVPSKLSLKAAAAALGVPKATMADRGRRGALDRLRHRRHLTARPAQAAADRRRRVGAEWDRVLCSAGKRGLDVALAPAGSGAR